MSTETTMSTEGTKAMSIRTIAIPLLCLPFLSCGDLTGEGTSAHRNIEKSGVTKVGGWDAVDMGETGFLLDGTVSKGGHSGHKFSLDFRLPAGESLRFFFFASRNLEGGVELSWMRTSGGEVEMGLSLNGKTHRHRIPSLDDREEIEVDVDVHNNHSDIHILVWNRSGSREDGEGCTFDGGCLYNTEDFAFDVWLGVGRASGLYWGGRGDADLVLSLEGPLPADSDA